MMTKKINSLKIIVTGGNGQVAFDIQRLATQLGHTVYAPDREALDITSAASITKILNQHQPDVLINAAAYTQVDRAEQEPERAYAVNREGARNLAIASAQVAIPLLHLSTDYVFDGNANTPYCETDPIHPVNCYGDSKWQGEEAIRAHCAQHIILRTSGVFGQHGHNFVKVMLKLARERPQLRVVADQIICPTPAADIAVTLIQLAELLSPSTTATHTQFGTYHYCGAEETTWHSFATAIIAEAGLTTPIVAIPTSEYPTPAKRPAYSVLNCQQLLRTFNIQQPSWRTGLRSVINHISNINIINNEANNDL